MRRGRKGEKEEGEGERERSLQFSWYARSPNTLATYACLRTANASRNGPAGMLGTIIVPSRMRKHCAYMHRMTTSAGGGRARPLHRNRHVSSSLSSLRLSLFLFLSFTLSLLLFHGSVLATVLQDMLVYAATGRTSCLLLSYMDIF